MTYMPNIKYMLVSISQEKYNSTSLFTYIVYTAKIKNCQARVQSPNPSPTKSLNKEKDEGFGLRAYTKIPWVTTIDKDMG